MRTEVGGQGERQVFAHLKNHPAIYVARTLADMGLPVMTRPSFDSVLHEEVIIGHEAVAMYMRLMKSAKIETIVQLQQRDSEPDLSHYEPDTQDQLRAYHQKCIEEKCERAAKAARVSGRMGEAQTYAAAIDIARRRRYRLLGGRPELDMPSFIEAIVAEELEKMRVETTSEQIG